MYKFKTELGVATNGGIFGGQGRIFCYRIEEFGEAKNKWSRHKTKKFASHNRKFRVRRGKPQKPKSHGPNTCI